MWLIGSLASVKQWSSGDRSRDAGKAAETSLIIMIKVTSHTYYTFGDNLIVCCILVSPSGALESVKQYGGEVVSTISCPQIGPGFEFIILEFCVSFACSPHASGGSLWVLQFTSTVQRHVVGEVRLIANSKLMK